MKVKITEKSEFPITMGSWRIWLERGNLVIYNSMIKDSKRATVVIPFGIGVLFLPSKGNKVQFTSVEEERWLSANNISYIIWKSPNRYYNIDEKHDFVITDGTLEWVGTHHGAVELAYNMFVNDATYAIIKRDNVYTIETDKPFTELTLPILRKRLVCGYCKNYDYKNNKCTINPDRASIISTSTTCEKRFELSNLFVMDASIVVPAPELDEWT